MRKLIYIVSVGVLMTLAACGTAGKQARKKQAEPEQVSLSLEERRKFDYFFPGSRADERKWAIRCRLRAL